MVLNGKIFQCHNEVVSALTLTVTSTGCRERSEKLMAVSRKDSLDRSTVSVTAVPVKYMRLLRKEGKCWYTFHTF